MQGKKLSDNISLKTGRSKVDNSNPKNLIVCISENLSIRIGGYCNRYKLMKGEVVGIGIEEVLTEKIR